MTDQPPDVVDHDNDRPDDLGVATNHDATDPAPVPIEEAAERLGITVNAVRQRLKRGTLQGERTAAGWVVVVPTDQAPGTVVGHRPNDRLTIGDRPRTNRPATDYGIAPLAELIADLTRQNQDLAAAAALWQERARFLGERLAALEAGPIGPIAGDVPQERNPASPRGDVATEASEPYRPASDSLALTWRRWWRRIRGMEQ